MALVVRSVAHMPLWQRARWHVEYWRLVVPLCRCAGVPKYRVATHDRHTGATRYGGYVLYWQALVPRVVCANAYFAGEQPGRYVHSIDTTLDEVVEWVDRRYLSPAHAAPGDKVVVDDARYYTDAFVASLHTFRDIDSGLDHDQLSVRFVHAYMDLRGADDIDDNDDDDHARQ